MKPPQRIKLEIGQTVWHGTTEVVVIAGNNVNYLAVPPHDADWFQRFGKDHWARARTIKDAYRCPKNGKIEDSPYARWYLTREAADEFMFLVKERENIGREVRALEDPTKLRRIQAILKEDQSQ